MKYWDIIWAGKLLYPGVNTNCDIKLQFWVIEIAESELNFSRHQHQDKSRRLTVCVSTISLVVVFQAQVKNK